MFKLQVDKDRESHMYRIVVGHLRNSYSICQFGSMAWHYITQPCDP